MSPLAILLLLALVALVVGAAHAPARLACIVIGAALCAVMFALVMWR